MCCLLKVELKYIFAIFLCTDQKVQYLMLCFVIYLVFVKNHWNVFHMYIYIHQTYFRFFYDNTYKSLKAYLTTTITRSVYLLLYVLATSISCYDKTFNLIKKSELWDLFTTCMFAYKVLLKIVTVNNGIQCQCHPRMFTIDTKGFILSSALMVKDDVLWSFL